MHQALNSYKLSPRAFAVKLCLVLLITLVTLGFINTLLPSYAGAVADNPIDQSTEGQGRAPDVIYDHCRDVASNKADSACDERKLENDYVWQAWNMATHQCKKEPLRDNKKYDCILKEAKKYITDAGNSKPKPDSRSSFEKAIDKRLDKESGSRLNPSEDSLQNINDVSNDPSNCDAETGVCTPSNAICKDGICQDPAADPSLDCSQKGCDIIKKYVNPLINLLSIAFGFIAVISIIIGGIQYSASAGDPQKVTQAKQRISKTLFAIFAYFFLYAFLQFIIPGGIFK